MNEQDKHIEEVAKDFIEKRMESVIGVFNNLFLDHREEMKTLVIDNMDKKFNGNMEKLNVRMDKQDIILKRLDERIKPFEETRTWFQDAKKGTGWVAGFLTSITLIVGAIIYLLKWTK